jgi:hypothetical protein
MRTYQGWLYNLFAADFGDMCWKIGDRQHVKSVVRDFVWDKKGVSRVLPRGRVETESDEEPPPPAPPRRDFLDDAEDPVPEILDLFDYKSSQ